MSAPIWITPSGSAGVYPALIPMQLQLVATPATVTYTLISGNLPPGLSFRSDGLISGTPSIVSKDTTSTFVIRATTTTNEIADRTFSLRISGDAIPAFTTPGGDLFGNIYDSVWIEFPVEYENPIPENKVTIRVLQGTLPPGLEINEYGLIRGYPEPPITLRNLPALTTLATATDQTNNYVTVLGTNNMFPGRPIIFTGSSIGNLVPGQVYYVRQIINASQIELANVPNGDVVSLTNGTGFMDATLPATQIGQPTKRQYTFTLELSSPLGSDTEIYSITVLNHYLPSNQGGPSPANAPNTRIPTIYNTRPPTYQVVDNPDYGYYVLPPDNSVDVPGMTYLPSENAYIGQFLANNYLAFKIIGHDFDDGALLYKFDDLPAFLTGDSVTGWVYGTPTNVDVPVDDIKEFSFTVFTYKQSNSGYRSPVTNFSLRVANKINGDIVWITDSDLGTINNASTSYKYVKATSDVDLTYEIIEGNLPPNLNFKSNGDIEGIVAYQPTSTYLEKNDTETFTFTVKAKAVDPTLAILVNSTRTFTLTIKQIYDVPTDSLYIKCTPSIADREILRTLLNNETLIPTQYLFRPEDPNFGKASSVVYAHAYGILSSTFNEYVEAVKKNHYWRNIILGELKTAVAKDDAGNVIYEVVYSDVIDNLQKYDPKYNYDYRYSQSVAEEIFWPRFIDLNEGPWYTSSSSIYTSFIFANDAQIITNLRMYDLLTQTGVPILLNQGVPTFYTSLTPGYARMVYPNSLENMRKRVEQNLGADYNFRLLPLWMTSQQADGNTLGFTPAWVICYTKPGYSSIVKNNIVNNWDYTLNKINFQIDRFTVNKQITYNYNSQLEPGAWTRFPSATPTPDPIDKENFYVLFPQKTILPNKSQYDL